jgi:hypothetical protein
LPAEVGTGAAPHSTLFLYVATAHGPTIAIAAVPSTNESPVYFSCDASFSVYSVRQNAATFLPSSEANCALPSATSCLPPDSAANSG